jgi:6-phosphogluconolactonase/Glucosamine-6-phosphate isomerase/deaminase
MPALSPDSYRDGEGEEEESSVFGNLLPNQIKPLKMNVAIYQNPQEVGKAAGSAAARLILDAIEARGTANIVLATGTSQFETINQLVLEKKIDWSKVVMFHLDEYINLPATHPASFRKYLRERFISKVVPLKATYLINGEGNAKKECDRLGDLIANQPIDVTLVGIGENGHLAFNDPPADFETNDPYIIVELDEACKKQQFGEGWFNSLDDVPQKAISMSIKQILKSKHIICSASEKRKALPVKNMFKEPVSNLYPASILRIHGNCRCFLDRDSAALIPGEFLS